MNAMGDPPAVMSLAELHLDPSEDPGTSWHPPRDHPSDWNRHGHLRDLSTAEVEAHELKPEAIDQIDAGVVLDAESSRYSAGDRV